VTPSALAEVEAGERRESMELLRGMNQTFNENFQSFLQMYAQANKLPYQPPQSSSSQLNEEEEEEEEEQKEVLFPFTDLVEPNEEVEVEKEAEEVEENEEEDEEPLRPKKKTRRSPRV